MTELQVKGLIGAMCNWMFGKGNYRIFTNGINDNGDNFLLIETTKSGKFIGSINEVYCTLERMFFNVAGK